MDNIQIIRKTCIAANPEIDRYCSLSERVDGKTHSEVFDGDDPYTICGYCGEVRSAPSGMIVKKGHGEVRPIRLADILLAMNKKMVSVELSLSQGSDGYTLAFMKDEGVELWNLAQDDLTAQTPETLAFLASLLANHHTS